MIYENLFVRTYLVGYEQEGESCVFLLYSTKPNYKVHYSIVIDSYAENGKNKTLKILKQDLKKQKLNMLVWTHPHKDHYIGLVDIIKKYCDKYTTILTPAIGNDLSKYDLGTQETMTYINSLVHNRKIADRYDVRQIASVCKTFLDKKLENIPLIQGIRFEIIAPFSDFGYSNADIRAVNYNWMSIGMIVQLYSKEHAEYFLYTGDMDKDTINMLLYNINERQEMEIPDCYAYIKIPHHGSIASVGILDIMSEENRSEMAASTIFRPQNLPNNDLLNEYKRKSIEVLRTDEMKDGIINKEYTLVP